MKKSERIRRLEGMLERMANQGGRDKRELAKARGRIKKLEAERAKAREPWRPPATEPLPSASWQCWPLLTCGHSMAYATPTTTADDIEKAYD